MARRPCAARLAHRDRRRLGGVWRRAADAGVVADRWRSRQPPRRCRKAV